MVLINYATKEIVAKMVYYGPGLCGKTTNLQHIYTRLNPKKRGKMISLATEADRTLFFDFLPVELGVVQGFRVRFQLYTVPGQVFYSSTRRLVLKGADAVIFVADSQADVMAKNVESVEDMKHNLLENDLDPLTIPIVFQYNKRDLDNVVDIWLLEKKLNYRNAPSFEAVAVDGTGVMETFKEVTNLLIRDLKRKHSLMNTDSIRELPQDIFEKKEEPAAPEVSLEDVLEPGSVIREEGTGVDVAAGGMLDQIETISLADTVQAEAFFDDVRKGAPAEEARQKAERLAGGARDITKPRKVELSESAEQKEREFTPEELELIEEAVYAEGLVEQDNAGYIGLDMTSPEMMEPEGVVGGSRIAAFEEGPANASEGISGPRAADETGNSGAPSGAQHVDIGPVLERLERLESEIALLRRSLAEMNKSGGVSERAEGLDGRLAEFEKKMVEAAEGQDRLLLSILESARDSKKANSDALSRIEDALKHIADKLGEGPKEKKKWF